MFRKPPINGIFTRKLFVLERGLIAPWCTNFTLKTNPTKTMFSLQSSINFQSFYKLYVIFKSNVDLKPIFLYRPEGVLLHDLTLGTKRNAQGTDRKLIAEALKEKKASVFVRERYTDAGVNNVLLKKNNKTEVQTLAVIRKIKQEVSTYCNILSI